MKKLLLSASLFFIGFGAIAQTYDALPTGSKPYGNQLYLTSTGLIIGGTGSAKFRVLGTKKYVDSLLALKADLSVLTNYVSKTGTETLTNKTLTAPVINTPEITNGTANALIVLNSSINNTPIGTSIPAIGNFTTANATGSSTLELLSHKGQANGYASLDGSGKVPVSQMPDALVGAVVYQGNYNASNNTPALPSATGNKGKYYVVSVAGTQQGFSFENGDWIISNGSIWQKVDNSTKVASVNGQTGAVNITDITGNAATATVWGNKTANFDTRVNSLGAIPVFDDAAFGQARYALAPEIKSWLGINDGSVLNNLVANSTLWNSQAFNSSLNTSVGPFLAYDNTNNQWRPTNNSQVKSSLGINDGSALNNVASSATNWGGQSANFSSLSTGTPYWFPALESESNLVKPFTAVKVKTALAISLQDVTTLNNVTNNAVVSGDGTVLNALSYSLGNDNKGLIGTLSNHPLAVMTNGAERLRILSNGSMGIGTAAPEAKLHINGSFIVKEEAQGTAYFRVAQSSVDTYLQAGSGSAGVNDAAVIFSGLGGVRPKMIVKGDGNIGIGTQTPSEKLDVEGNVRTNGVFLKAGSGVGLNVTNQTDADFQIEVSAPGAINKFAGLQTSTHAPLVLQQFGDKVGIGVINPTEVLDINGNIKASGLAGSNDSPVLADASGVLKRGALPGYALLNSDNTYSGNQTYNNGTVYINSSDGSAIFNDATLIIKNTNVKTFSSIGQGIATFGLTGQTAQTSINNNRLMVTESNGNTTEYLGGAVKKIVSGTAYTSTFPNDNGTVALTKQFESGTYTPTVTSISNVTSPSSAVAHYQRIGKEVTVYGQIAGSFSNGTAANASISVSLPIASNLTALEDVSGYGSGTLTSYPASVSILADTSNDWAVVVVGGFPAQSNTIRFSFTYTIK